jgi:hypothetical protein
MYAPVPYQRRFAFGLQPGLAALAILGWPALQHWLDGRLHQWRLAPATSAALASRLVTYVGVMGCSLGTIAVFAVMTLSAATNMPIQVYTIDRDSYAAAQQLAAQTGPDDVLLCAWDTCNVLAGVMPGRVVLGYEVATLHASAKRASVEALYRGELTTSQIRDVLQANRVTYVLYGAEERALGSFDPGAAMGLSIVTRVGDAIVYAAVPNA